MMKEYYREGAIQNKRVRGPKKIGDLILQRFTFGKAKSIGIHIGEDVIIAFSLGGKIRSLTLSGDYEWVNIFRYEHE